MDPGHWLIAIGIGIEAAAGFFLSASAIKSQGTRVRIFDYEVIANQAELGQNLEVQKNDPDLPGGLPDFFATAYKAAVAIQMGHRRV